MPSFLSSLPNACDSGWSLTVPAQLPPYLVTNTSPASLSSFGVGRLASASQIAATVSGHSGQRRAMPVFGLGKSIIAPSRSTAARGRLPQSLRIPGRLWRSPSRRGRLDAGREVSEKFFLPVKGHARADSPQDVARFVSGREVLRLVGQLAQRLGERLQECPHGCKAQASRLVCRGCECCPAELEQALGDRRAVQLAEAVGQ